MDYNFDSKVDRDSMYIASDQLNGIFSKLKKKLKKVTRKIGKATLGKKVYKKLSKFESKNRKKLKKLGAIALVATGVYMYGDKIAAFMQKSGGSKILKGASSKLVKAAIAKKVAEKAQKMQMPDLSQLPPEQILTNPAFNELSQKVAQEVGAVYGGNIGDSETGAILAGEGAAEIPYQIEKEESKILPLAIGGIALLFMV